MTRAQAAAVVRQFEDAVRADAFRGTAYPHEFQAIEDAYHRARERLIARLTKEQDA